MKLLITTVGSRGDVQPYVALGKGLRAAGHTVTVCTSVRFEGFVREHGLAYAYLNDGLVALLDTAVGRGALEDLGSFWLGVRTFIQLVKRTGPIQRALIEEGGQAAQAVNPDLILYNSKMPGMHYADRLAIPAVLAVLFPQLVPTAAFPTVGFPTWPLGGGYNRLTYRLVLALAGRVGGSHLKSWRARAGLPPQTRGTGLLQRSDGSRIPVLHGFSQHVVPVPPDWPPEVHTTGYWFLDRPADWQPPAALECFLAAGEPPVYVGFGSMAGRNPERTTRIVIAALQQAGLRGVLATGWGGLATGEVPASIHLLDQAPHDWLFPQMAAVVHHGGAGTTAAGLRAGCPTIICPFFGDQPFWGRRAHELGVGSRPVPQKQLSSDKLAAALRDVAGNVAIRRQALALGDRIRSEDGIANAVAIIEKEFAK